MARYLAVNQLGLDEILRILTTNHRLGGDRFGPSELAAWAAEVEQHMADGNGQYFEIRAADAVSGQTEIHYLSDESIEWAGEDDEDE